MTKESFDHGEMVLERLDEISRLLVLTIRTQLASQSEAINRLYSVGISRGRIADLLGTTPGTVNQELVRAKKRAGSRSH